PAAPAAAPRLARTASASPPVRPAPGNRRRVLTARVRLLHWPPAVPAHTRAPPPAAETAPRRLPPLPRRSAAPPDCDPPAPPAHQAHQAHRPPAALPPPPRRRLPRRPPA